MYFDDVREKFELAINKLLPDTQSVLNSALSLAHKEHEGQTRKQHAKRDDVDPYLIHPLRVCLILMNEAQICDKTALAAAILHDVVEDGISRPTMEDIEKLFGSRIAETVAYLTKPEGENGPLSAEELHPYHESFFAAPLHVRLVKLSDRLDNIRETLLVDRPKFQHRYLNETRDIYIPLAKFTSFYYAEQLTVTCDQLEALLGKAR